MFSKRKHMVLQSLGLNYPAIRMLGFTVEQLIIVVVPKGNSAAMRRELDLCGRKLFLYPGMKQPDLAEVLGVQESAFCVYPYENSVKGNKFLGVLSGMVCRNRVGNNEIRNLPVVLMEGGMVDFSELDCFAIYEEEDNVQHAEFAKVVPGKDCIPLVKERISNFVVQDGSMRSVLLTAACFLPECIFSDKTMEEYVDVVDRMIIEEEENRDRHGLASIFLQALFEWQAAKGFCNVRELPNLDMQTTDNIDNYIFYDQDFLYMKDEFYKEIVRDMLVPYSVSEVKKDLMNEGILVSDKSKTYGTKVSYTSVAGVPQRVRMLKFRRERMQPLGKIDFITSCLITRGGAHDED